MISNEPIFHFVDQKHNLLFYNQLVSTKVSFIVAHNRFCNRFLCNVSERSSSSKRKKSFLGLEKDSTTKSRILNSKFSFCNGLGTHLHLLPEALLQTASRVLNFAIFNKLAILASFLFT